jgi:arylsulfatase A-like enzyme
VRTPNIDRIAKGGHALHHMRANCTVCSPSRAALLTGRYADRVGVPGVIRTQPKIPGDTSTRRADARR